MTQQYPPFRPPAPTARPEGLDEDTVRLPARPPRMPVRPLPQQRQPVDPLPAPPRPSSGESPARTWPWLLGIAVLVPLIVVGGALFGNRTTLPPTPTTLPPRPSASAEATRPAAPLEIATDGTYAVGTDLPAGTYRSAGARTATGRCAWTTRAGSATVGRGTGAAGQRQVAEITEKVKAFETAGCAPWVKVG
jgi:hypothetical protein